MLRLRGKGPCPHLATSLDEKTDRHTVTRTHRMEKARADPVLQAKGARRRQTAVLPGGPGEPSNRVMGSTWERERNGRQQRG